MSHMSKVCIFSAVGAAVGMKIGPASDVCRSDSATPGATKIDVTVITASQSSPEDYKEADYKEALHQCNEVIGSSRSTDDFDGIQGGCESDDEGPHDIIIAKFGNQPVGALDFYIQDEVVNVNYLGVHRNCQGKFGLLAMGNKLGCNDQAVRCAASCARVGAKAGDFINEFEENDSVSAPPAGSVFPETMEELGREERHLLYFCGSQNLSAVKWLFKMGGCLFVQDSNGTSCLHHACRSGSLNIVQFLLEKGLDPNCQDCAGWTPLHVACEMGNRFAVVKLLLKFKADTGVKDCFSKTPLDHSKDMAVRELLIRASDEDEEVLVRPTPESSSASASNNIGFFDRDISIVPEAFSPNTSPHRASAGRSISPSPGGDIDVEPFFVPSPPELEFNNHEKILSQIGLDFFNANPGQGLSFLISSGCVSDSPQPLLQHITSGVNNVKGDRTVFGQFLGESYSLSQILRLELMNNLELEHTGIVEALHLVGRNMSWPADFEKLDRLSFCCALMWWRKHEESEMTKPTRPVRKFDGYGLKSVLKKKTELHQIMFAVLILHMNLHSMTGTKVSTMRLDEWFEFCDGITKLPKEFLTQLYKDCSTMNRAIVITKPPKPDRSISMKMLHQNVDASGWIRLEGALLPQLETTFWQKTPNSDIWCERGPTSIEKGSSGPMEYAAGLSPFPAYRQTRVDGRNPHVQQFNPNQCLGGRGPLTMSKRGKNVYCICAAGTLFFMRSDAPGQAPWAYVYLPGNQCSVEPPSNPGLGHGASLPKISISATDSQSLRAIILHEDAKCTRVELPRLMLQIHDSNTFVMWQDALQKHSFVGDGQTSLAVAA
eukprot:gene1328-374_t